MPTIIQLSEDFDLVEEVSKTENFNFLIKRWERQHHDLNRAKLNIPRSDDMIIGSRVRPILPKEGEEGHVEGVRKRQGGRASVAGAHVVDVHHLTSNAHGPVLRSHEYYVDRLFLKENTTEEIYDELVKPLVELAKNGGIGTVFAYGQTGAGKTYTINALENLVAKDLLATFPSDHNIFVSIFELGGTLNSAFDLLNERQPISILEDSFGDTRLLGAKEIRVLKTAELTNLIETANSFRRVAQTHKNDQSSRSHAICKLTFTNTRAPSAPDGVLYLIDLAGSEISADKVRHTPELMKEAKDINKSLSVLKECVRGRALYSAEAEQKPYVPFRHSALTKVLKHVFDPAADRVCKTAVIACLNPSFMDVEGTKNTLRYAEMLRVPVPARKAVEFDEKIPRTWNNDQTKAWILENCGNPVLNVEYLAPYQTGAQLVGMSKREFIDRCLATHNVSIEQAEAFHSKLWRLHVDAKYASTAKPNDTMSLTSAAPGDQRIPFKERTRPGMVVKYSTTKKGDAADEMAVILSEAPAAAAVESGDEGKQYLCAVVSKGEYLNAYVVNIWHQRIVKAEAMTQEVVLEYDLATRYYYPVI